MRLPAPSPSVLGSPIDWRWALPVVMLLVSGALAGRTLGTAQLWTLLVIAPVLEEAVFRAGVHELLLRRARYPHQMSIVLTALLFGLAHVLVRGDVSAFLVTIPALAIGTIYRRSRQVRTCVAAHAAMNALWLIWGAIGLAWLPVA